jgi:hypothetical protein
MKLKLVALAARAELFQASDFAMPVAGGRSHPLLVEDGDGRGLYLTIGLPGKEAAPHDHGIWCINASVSGREHHEFFRRTDAGTQPGHATVLKVGEVMVEPGDGRPRYPCDQGRGRPAGGRARVVRLRADSFSLGGLVPSAIRLDADDAIALACRSAGVLARSNKLVQIHGAAVLESGTVRRYISILQFVRERLLLTNKLRLLRT